MNSLLNNKQFVKRLEEFSKNFLQKLWFKQYKEHNIIMELNNAPSLVFEESDAERAFLIEQLEADLRGISVEQFRAMRWHHSEFVTLFSRKEKENRNPNKEAARSL